MKKVIDSIALRCIAHATEDLDKVKKAMEFIAGRGDFEVEETKGYHGNPIRILSIEIKKPREIEEFWRRMRELGVVEEILPIIDDIVDEDGFLYLRFDKQEAYMERVAITTGGDTIAMRVKLLSYPKKRENSIKNFREFLVALH